MLVLLFVVLTIVFYLLDIQASWDSSILTLVLNIVFVIIPALVITFIAARSFMRTGVWPVLWMGIGVLTFGLAAVLSNWLRITSSNNATTVYSIVALLAGVFHFFAGFFALNRVPPREPGSGRLSALLQVYLIALALIVFRHCNRRAWTITAIRCIGGGNPNTSDGTGNGSITFPPGGFNAFPPVLQVEIVFALLVFSGAAVDMPVNGWGHTAKNGWVTDKLDCAECPVFWRCLFIYCCMGHIERGQEPKNCRLMKLWPTSSRY